jgi:polyisoprenoid-binding protein YceI
MNLKRRALLILMAALAAVSAQAQQRVLVLDPQASKVTFTLKATGHEVEGAFALKNGRVAFDPAAGAASGEIVIDLEGAETGNKSRDKTMHEEVLETQKHPTAVFRAEKVRGTVPESGAGQLTLEGTLSFHGADHKVSLPAKVDVQNGRVQADTQFEIPYVEWGLHDPSIIMLRVAKVVTVKIHAVGTLEAGEGAK